MSAVVLWLLPHCPIQAACLETVAYYIMPLGFWHSWTMFSPDPMRDTMTLEADVVDRQGMRYGFSFPKQVDYSGWAAVPRFRHPKFAANLGAPELKFQRELAARHVVRQLDVAADAYPLSVNLIAQIRTSPPPGGPPADPMLATHPILLDTIVFSQAGEVKP